LFPRPREYRGARGVDKKYARQCPEYGIDLQNVSPHARKYSVK